MPRLVVIGGGPAGVTAALEAAHRGAQVTLVEAAHLGGRATWHSLVPSKVFLSAAEALGTARPWLDAPLPRPPLALLRERIHALAVAQSRAQQEALIHAGVTLVQAVAAFESPHILRLEGEDGRQMRLEFDIAILATGSEPIFLPQLKPDGKRLLAPRAMAHLETWPEHLIMIGGGVTGSEYVSFFNQMGVPTTWVTDLPTFLPRVDADVAAAFAAIMAARGVALYPNAPVEAAESGDQGVRVVLRDGRVLEGSHAFIAIGRQADTARLNLAAVGLSASRRGLVVDAFGRTALSHIYAIGDVAGPPYTVNRAQAQARVAVRHALGLPTLPLDAVVTAEAIYSDPQVAQVGLGEDAVRQQGRMVRILRADFAQGLKPQLGAHAQGFLKLVVEAQSGHLLGAAALGSHAAELINALAVAVQMRATLDDLARWAPAYPTLGDLVGIAVHGYGV